MKKMLIGMLTYLTRNIRSFVEYDVHQYVRFQYDPRVPHANTIKYI